MSVFGGMPLMAKAILGGGLAGGALGGALGAASGNEGGFSSGALKGAAVGGVFGAGGSSMVTRGGAVNNAMRAFGGMADDLLGNTSNKGFIRAAKSNEAIKAERSILEEAQATANARKTQMQEEYDMDFKAFNDRRTGEGHEAITKKEYNQIHKDIDIGTVGENSDLRITPEMQRGMNYESLLAARRESGKANKAIRDFDSTNRELMESNRAIMADSPSASGSIEDMFYNMGGGARARADANIASYRKMAGQTDLDDAGYARMAEMESSMGVDLTRSIRNSDPSSMNKDLAGYDQHVANMKDNVAARNRAIIMGGAGLTGGMVGINSGKRRNHRRGMNSRRGARF